MKKKLSYLLLLLLLPVFAFAQPAEKNITGVWKGEFYVDSTKKSYPFELTISEDKGKYTGYSRISFEENGIPQVVFRNHKIKVTDNEIIIEDDNQLSQASSVSQPKEVKKTMVLTLITMDTSMQLSGTWNTTRTRRYLAASGSVQMQHKIDYKSTDIFKKLDELKLADKLSFTKTPVEEPVAKLDKVILPGITKTTGAKKTIAPLASVSKPNLSMRPKYMPVPVIQKETPPIVVKTEQPKPEIKKSIPPTVKATPVTKPKEVLVAKVDKPAPKPVAVQEKKPAPVVPVVPVVAPPVVKKNIPPAVIANAAVDVAKRSNNNQQSLYYKSDSLTLTLYDNGEIDGDTVSVLLNGKVIIAKKGLDIKPNSYTIYFDRNTPDSQMLVMYAENLGSIPPNTGLLVVREGQSVYEVRFSADLKTNAAIILRRKRDE